MTRSWLSQPRCHIHIVTPGQPSPSRQRSRRCIALQIRVTLCNSAFPVPREPDAGATTAADPFVFLPTPRIGAESRQRLAVSAQESTSFSRPSTHPAFARPVRCGYPRPSRACGSRAMACLCREVQHGSRSLYRSAYAQFHTPLSVSNANRSGPCPTAPPCYARTAR